MSEVDVLIIAALKEEYEAARDAGKAPDAQSDGVARWEDRDIESPTPYLIGTYKVKGRPSITIALARPTRKGSNAAGPVASSLVTRLQPHCLAMCGVCAGNPADLVLGDVIVAEMVYSYDEGKRKKETFEGDHRQIPSQDTWVRAAQDLTPNGLPSFGPASQEEAKRWVLMDRRSSADVGALDRP
jgi:nucleoside phosphorylase